MKFQNVMNKKMAETKASMGFHFPDIFKSVSEMPLNIPIDPIECRNGKTISIQAGANFFSSPQEKLNDFNDYSSFELGVDKDVALFLHLLGYSPEVSEIRNNLFIFSFVSAEDVQKTIEVNGGIKKRVVVYHIK